MSCFITCSAYSQRKSILGGNHTQCMCASLSACVCVDGHLATRVDGELCGQIGGAHEVTMSCYTCFGPGGSALGSPPSSPPKSFTFISAWVSSFIEAKRQLKVGAQPMSWTTTERKPLAKQHHSFTESN